VASTGVNTSTVDVAKAIPAVCKTFKGTLKQGDTETIEFDLDGVGA
jgi:hypothetical protein